MIKKFTILIISIGILLHAYIALFESSGGISKFAIGSFMWSCTPYIAGTLLIIFIKLPFEYAIGGIVIPLITDSMLYYEVFVNPTSSTAAIGYLYLPAWNLFIFLPIGIILSILLIKSYRKIISRHFTADKK
jgi:hypothetical protein